MQWRRFLLGASAAVMASACASLLRSDFKTPVVTFRDARITGLGISGGSVDVLLGVYNPNKYRLEGTRLTYQVMIGDSVKLGEGEYSDKFEVNEGDTTIVTLPLSFTYAGLGTAGRQLIESGSVEYRVLGDLTVATPIGNRTHSYDRKGRFSSLGR